MQGSILILIIGAAIVSCWSISLLNKEISLRQQIVAQQTANKVEFDTMKKKIIQNSKLSDKYKTALIEVLTAYTEGRKSDGDQLLMKWSNEAIPVLDSKLYTQLSNIITSSRDKFALEQKHLLDMKREYETFVSVFPNRFVFQLAKLEPLDVVVVTSTSTESSFETGLDDEVDL